MGAVETRRCLKVFIGVVGVGGLVIAIDLSEDGPRAMALVGARKGMVKSRAFEMMCTRLKHFRRVGSNRKRSYLKTFVKRYARIRSYIEVARVFLSTEDLLNFTNVLLHRVAIAIIDDKLYNEIKITYKIIEGNPKPRYMENLVVIADNLANYFRILLKSSPEKFEEEVRNFEK